MDNIIEYDFPENNPDPFTKDFEGNFFFYANGFSNLSLSTEDFNFENFNRHIPIGYKTIIILERLALLENGEIDKKWPNTTNEISDEFLLSSNLNISFFASDWGREIASKTVYKPNSKKADLSSCTWENYEDAIQYGKNVTSRHANKILVSRIIETINWH